MSSLRLLLVLLCLAPAACLAAPDERPGRWWVAMDLGGADLSFERAGTTRDETSLFLSFRGGYEFGNRLRLGFETNGFGIESGNLMDPSKGEGISQLALATVEWHLVAGQGWFVKAGAGWNSYWNHREGTRQTASGAWLAGVGYEFKVSPGLHVSPFLQAHGGDAAGVSYDTVTAGVALMWKFR